MAGWGEEWWSGSAAPAGSLSLLRSVSEKVSWCLLLTTASLAPQALHAGVYVSQASLLQLSLEQSICLLTDEWTGAGSITRQGEDTDPRDRKEDGSRY